MRHSTQYRPSSHIGCPRWSLARIVVWALVLWFVAMVIILSTYDLVGDL